MNFNRIACVLIPNFGLSVQLQKDPTLLLEAAVLAENEREAAVIIEVNGKADRAGIRPGLTVSQAHSLCPDLHVLLHNETAETSESQRLTRCLQDIVPLVESDSPAVFFLEADGLELLYGDHAELASRLIAKIKEEQYPVSVGIAANKFAARVAAEVSHCYQHTCIPEGCQREFLENLPITHLRLDPETETRLQQLGLRTMGQLAAFPTNELQERFGHEGWRLSILARGDDPEYLLPETQTEELIATSYPPTPLSRATAISSQVERLLEQLFVPLEKEGKGCRSLAIRLVFTNTDEKWLTLSVARPTLLIGTFTRQLGSKLEQARVPSPVTEITLTITETSPLQITQMPLIGESGVTTPHTGSDNHLARILSQNQLYRPRLNYSPVPENSFLLIPFDFNTRGRKKSEPSGSNTHLPYYSLRRISGLRLLTPPSEAKVTGADGKPKQLLVGRQRHRIKSLTGPWKLSGNWWSRDFSRQYYEIETSSRQQYLLYYDTITSRWFLQGVFD